MPQWAMPPRQRSLTPSTPLYDPSVQTEDPPGWQQQQDYDQRYAERQQQYQEAAAAKTAVSEAKRVATEQKNAANNVNEAAWRTAGTESYTDANGVLQKITDPLTGKDKTLDATGPKQWDQSGKAFQITRRDGAMQQKFLDEKAPIVPNPNDPKDPNLYRANKNAPWEPVDTQAGILSDDPTERQASANHLKGLKQSELTQKMKELDAQAPSSEEYPAKGEKRDELMRRAQAGEQLQPEEQKQVAAFQKHLDIVAQKKKLAQDHAALGAQSLDDFTAAKVKELGPDQARVLKSQKHENQLKNLHVVERSLQSEQAQLEAERDALQAKQDAGMTPAEMAQHAAQVASLQVRGQAWQAKNANLQSTLQKTQQALSTPTAPKAPILSPEEHEATASELAKDTGKLQSSSQDFQTAQAKLIADQNDFEDQKEGRIGSETTNAERLMNANWERQNVEELNQRAEALKAHASVLQSAAEKQKQEFRAKREESLAGAATKGMAAQLSAIEDDAAQRIAATNDPVEQAAIKDEAQKSQQRLLDGAAAKEKEMATFRQAASEFASANNADSPGYEERVAKFAKANGKSRADFETALLDHDALTNWPDPTAVNDGRLSDATKEKLGAGLSTIAETGTRLLQGTVGKLLEKAVPSAFDAKEQQDVVRRTSTGDWTFNPFMGWEEDKVMSKMEEGVDGHKPSDAEKAQILKQVHQFQGETAGPMLEALQDSSQFQDWMKHYQQRNGEQNLGLKSTQADILRAYLKSDEAKSGWNWIKTASGDVWDSIKNWGTGMGAGIGSAIFGTDGAYNPDLMQWDLNRQQDYSKAMELAGQKGLVNETINQAASIAPALIGGRLAGVMSKTVGALGARAGVALGELEASALSVVATTESAGLSWAARQVAGAAGKGYNVLASSASKWATEIGLGGSIGTAGLQSYAQGFQQAYAAARASGMDAETAASQAQLPATLMGLSTALVMTATGAKGVESIYANNSGPTFRDLAKKLGGTGGVLAALKDKEFRSLAKNIVEHGLGEAWSEVKEEGLDQWLQGLVEMGTFNPNKTITDLAADSANAGVWGGILGAAVPGVMGAASGVKNLRADVKEGRSETNDKLAALAPYNAASTAFHSSIPSPVLLRGQQGHANAQAHTEALATADAAVTQAQQALSTATSPNAQVSAHEALATAQQERLAVIHRMAGTEAAPTQEQLVAAQSELAGTSDQDSADVADAAMSLHQNGPAALNEHELRTLGLARDGKGGFKSVSDGPTGLPRVSFTPEGAPIFEQGFLNSVSQNFPAVAAILPSSEHAQRALLAPDGLKQEGDAKTDTAQPAKASKPAKAPTTLEFDVTVDGQKTPVRVSAPDEATAIAHVRSMGKGMVQDGAATLVSLPPQLSSNGVQGEPAPGPKTNINTAVPSVGMNVGQMRDAIATAHIKSTKKAPTPAEARSHAEMAVSLARELNRWKKIFPNVKIVSGITGGGLQVKPGQGLQLDFTRLANTARTTGANAATWAKQAMQEEVIHAVAVQLEADGKWNAAELFRKLPPALQKLVKDGYKSDDPHNLGHEFMRMLVQGEINAGQLTEFNAKPGLIEDIKKALKALLNYFGDLYGNLQKQGADESTLNLINEISTSIKTTLDSLQTTDGPVEVRGDELPNKSGRGLEGSTVPVSGTAKGPTNADGQLVPFRKPSAKGKNATGKDGRRGEIISESDGQLKIAWHDGTTSEIAESDLASRSTSTQMHKGNNVVVDITQNVVTVYSYDEDGNPTIIHQSRNLSKASDETVQREIDFANRKAESHAQERNLSGYDDVDGKRVSVPKQSPRTETVTTPQNGREDETKAQAREKGLLDSTGAPVELSAGAARLVADTDAQAILEQLQGAFGKNALPDTAENRARELTEVSRGKKGVGYTVQDAIDARLLQVTDGNIRPVASLPAGVATPVEVKAPVQSKGTAEDPASRQLLKTGIVAKIKERGGVTSLSQARRIKGAGWQPKGEWDGAIDADGKSLIRHPGIWATGSGAESAFPDVVANDLGFDTAHEMWEALKQELASAKNLKENPDPRITEGERLGKVMDGQKRQFKVDTAKRSSDHPLKLQPGMLESGDMVLVNGEKMTVTQRFPDGAVMLEDGTKYGEQVVENGETIWVEDTEGADTRMKSMNELFKFLRSNPALKYDKTAKEWGLTEAEIEQVRKSAETMMAKQREKAPKAPASTPTDFTLESPESDQLKAEQKKKSDKKKMEALADKPLTGTMGDTTPDMLDPNADEVPLFTQSKKPETDFGNKNPTIRQGTVGGMLSDGEVVITSSGRETTPFPRLGFDTDRKAQATVKRVDKWLYDNAIAEAMSRGDDFNARAFGSENPSKLPQASKDSMEEYLFGTQPAIPQPFLKPMGNKPATKSETTSQAPEAGSEKPTVSNDTKLTPAEQAIKDEFNDMLGGALNAQSLEAPTYTTAIPRERMARFIDLAGKWLDSGVNTPQKLAESITRIGLAVRPYTMALWRAMQVSDGTLEAQPAWDDVYAALDTPIHTPETLKGEKIDKEWTAFDENSGTLGIPRDQMPQIKSEQRGAMANFLRARGIQFTLSTALPGTLKPTQAEYSQKKVDKARAYTKEAAENGTPDRALLVSEDNQVVDGHHQWMAALHDRPDQPMKIIRLGAPIATILNEIREMPTMETADGEKPAEVDTTKNSVTSENEPNLVPSGDSAETTDVTTSGDGAGIGGNQLGGKSGRNSTGRGSKAGGKRGTGTSSNDSTSGAVGDSVEGAPGGVDPSERSGNTRNEPVATTNYRITESDKIGEGGLKAKFNQNVAAIKLVKSLEAEGRKPTASEQAILVKYVGWGGMKGVFAQSNKQWSREYSVLKELLTPEEYEAANRSMLDSHYTSPTVVQRGVWAALSRFGFRGGRMVEGGVGIGHFIGMMPNEARANSSHVGIEKDHITAKIAAYLYPEATIHNVGFEAADLQPEFFDASAGNPPFGQQQLFDKKFPHLSKFSIHNYFIAKQLELLRNGGVAGFVVSHNFLDALDPAAREYIATKAQFLGAIRLPNTAFKENANTEVVTDIVFFQKADGGGDTAWTKSRKIKYGDNEYSLNSYIEENPDMALGTISFAGSMYGPGEYSLDPKEGDLGEQLDEAVAKLPKDIYHAVSAETVKRLTTSEPMGDKVKVGSYFVQDGVLHKRLSDVNMERRSGPVEGLNPTAAERIKGIIGIREVFNDLVAAEMDSGTPEAKATMLRNRLNVVYDQFVKVHGYLNQQANRRAFYDDPESARVLGLESDFDPGISPAVAKKNGVPVKKPSAKKAAIFSKRVNSPYQEVTQVSTPQEALAVSMNQRGGVFPSYMAELTGLPEPEIMEALNGLVYMDPSGGYVVAAEYLSGNVRRKLREAKAQGLDENVAALEKVIPLDIEPLDIAAPIGAPWVTADDYNQFATELGKEDFKIIQNKSSGGWSVTNDGRSNESLEIWGTVDKPLGSILNDIMNSKAPVVTYIDADDKRVVHKEKTALASSKADLIHEQWKEWIWQEEARRVRLARVYNDTYNNYVDPKYDGSHLTLSGISALVKLRAHQKNVAWRIITSGNTLLDHVVGAGKTFAGIAGFMELKRLGRVKKPLFVVPNHLVTQWRDDFIKLYPNANILFARPSDFQKDKRKLLFAKILTGSYDAVIIGHSSLSKIGMEPEGEKALLKEFREELVQSLREMVAAGANGRVQAQLQRQIESVDAKMDRLAARTKSDDVVTFEELGIDGMFVDEAHEFKNLFYTTQMQRVAGLGNAAGSAKAFDLFLKTRQLRKKFGGKAPLVFATGTPLSNSLVEMFTLQRYLQPTELEEMGLKTLDAWSKVYAEVKQVYEVDATGTGMRMSTRFANFQNAGELSMVYRTVADVITMKDLEAQAIAETGKSFPVPKVKGGKPANFAVPRSEAQADYFGVPVVTGTDAEGNEIIEFPEGSICWRVDNMPDDPREDNMLKLTSDARKAGLDMRLVNPDYGDFPGSKINLAVKEMVNIHKDTTADKGTQLVFCDLSVPSSARGEATKASKAVSASQYWIKNGDNLEIVNGASEVTLDKYPGFSFFVYKSNDKDRPWRIVERRTGKFFLRDKSKAALLAAANQLPGNVEQMSSVVERDAVSLEEITQFLEEQSATKEADGSEESDVADDSTQTISMDELLADSSSFSVYDDMKAKLIAAGIPAAEIAFIHDFKTPEAKTKLFAAVNAGTVRFLFGSTAKLGAGTNVQKRMVALHHMDAPWRPSDLEQREGRIIRQGNELYAADPEGFSVIINRYATQQTYDTRMWQINEHKARGIEGFRMANSSTRVIEDIGGEAANASDMKSAASGDPLIQREIELRQSIDKLKILQRGFTQNQHRAQSELTRESGWPQRLADFNKWINRMIETRDNGEKKLRMISGEVYFTPEGEGKEKKPGNMDGMAEVFGEIVKSGHPSRQFSIGEYRGFRISAQKDNNELTIGVVPLWQRDDATFVGLDNKAAGYTSSDVFNPYGFLTRIDNFLSKFEGRKTRAEAYAKESQEKVDNLKKVVAQTFPKAAELSTMVAEHAQVKSELMQGRARRAVTPGEANEKPPLESQSFGELLTEAGADLSELDALYDASGQEESGSRTIGNPERSLGGGVNSPNDPVIFSTDQLYDDQFTPQTFEQWRERAMEMLDHDYKGTADYLIRYGMASGGAGLRPAENMAAQMIVERESRLPMTPERIRFLQSMVWAYRLSGTDQARTLASRRDPFKTPTERNREFITKMIMTPPTDMAKKIEAAESPKQRENLLNADRQRIAKIQRAFQKMGTSLDEVLNGDVKLGLVNHSIAQATLNGLDGARLKAAEMAQKAQLSVQEIAKATGLKPAEVKAVADDRRAQAIADLIRRAKLRQEATGLQAQALEATIDFSETDGMTEAELLAWAEGKANEMGLFPSSQLGQRKTVTRKKPSLFVPPTAVGAKKSAAQPVSDPFGPMKDMGGPTKGHQLELPEAGKPLPIENQGTSRQTGPGDMSALDPQNKIGENRVPAVSPDRYIEPPAEYSVRVGADMANPEDMARLARIAQAATSSPLDMVKEVWINNILSGPATHAANITGNAVSGAWDFTMQRGMEALWNLAANDPKGATFGEMGHIMKALAPAISEGYRLMVKTWNTESDHFTHEVLNQPTLFDIGPQGEKMRTAIGGTTGRIIRIPGRALMAMDGFFKRLFGQMEAAAQAYRIAKSEGLKGDALQKRINTLVTTPDSRAWQLAVEKATDLTFQEKLPEVVQILQRGLNMTRIGSFLIPFIRTPYNIFRTGIRKSPIGMANLAWHIIKHGLAKIDTSSKAGRALGSVGVKTGIEVTTAIPAQMVRWLAEQTFAMAGMALLWGAAAGDDDDDKKQFLITGSPPRDKGLRALNDRAVGGGYQIKIGGMTINYGRIEPIATVLGTMMDAIKAVKSGASKGATAAAILDNLKGQVMNKTFLQGIAGIIDGLERPGKWDEKAKNSLLAALVPNIIRQPLRNTDETVRDYSTADWWYPAWPSADNGGAPVVDPVTGEDKTKGGNAVSRLVQQPVAPRGELTSVDRTLIEFNRLHPESAWAPSIKDNIINYSPKHGSTPAVEVRLNAAAFHGYQQRTALHFKQAIAGRSFAADADGVEKIKDIYTKAESRAKEELRRRPLAQLGEVK